MTAVEPRTATDEPEAGTTTGRIRGRHEGGLAVFRGIPFAEPPVGPDRFMAPRPARTWDGVREAFAFGPPPPQEIPVPETFAFGPPPPHESHGSGDAAPTDDRTDGDWLTVNVWTPGVDPAAARPVIVWIYGGAYKVGSSDEPYYDAHRIAGDGDVVTVTFNHRVGIEGFAQIDGAPANRGVLDQIAALEWVRDNIAAFGGDPAQVTVVGESAGAGAVACLLTAPAARGLFHRAIVQSLPGTFFSPELAEDVTAAIAAEMGLRPTVADLSGVAPRVLPAAGAAVSRALRSHQDRWGAVALTPTPFSPVVDGDVLPVTPWRALADGAARDVDLIVGHTRDEYRLFVATSELVGQIDDARAAEALRVFGPGPDPERAYREAFPDASPERLFELVQSDWLMRMPSLHLAEAQVRGGGRAHMYEVTWSAPGNGGALGACHGLDVLLLFGVYDTDLGRLFLGPDGVPEAERLSAHVRRAWTDFAATGDPGWPAYDTEQRLTRLLDTEPRTSAYPEEASRRLWRDHVFAPLPLVRDRDR
ncbi:carboxylesterase/lipase family protein [Nocardiopsis sp. YSL2]|uniref:carboxylesterase/lipase family protein n=1 Tax=Nocardiopsis sp. YSL2 TaxID=2939492 RepID=UPI0026F41D52|nr:carboxylesterase family protein [Nocardiopsis sp. YSL2]